MSNLRDINLITQVPTLKVGDIKNGNYTEVESDGTLISHGSATVYKDVDFPIIIRTTGTGIPTLEPLQGNITAPQWQVNDYNVCEGQELIHEWAEGTQINWHLHMITNGLEETDKFVKWQVEYFYIVPNSAITASVTTSSEYKIPANTPDKSMFIVPIANFTPADGKIGSQVYAKLSRITSSGTAPNANPWCTMLQMHVECDTNGSREITSK